MVRRLKELEERIVESEAWSEEEPLYSLLRHETLLVGSSSGSKKDDDNDVEEGAKKMMAVVGGECGTVVMKAENVVDKVPFSPRKALKVIAEREPELFGAVTAAEPSQANASSATGQQQQQAPPEEGIVGAKLTKLDLFFRKFFRLMHLRLHSFSRKLNLTEATTRNIWDTMVYSLEREESLRLLHCRHMDQILICGIYGICKIMDEERKFKEIINVYREQPQFTESTYRCVKDGKGGTVDIINFYNGVYLPSMKAVIYGFKGKQQQQPSTSKKPVIHVDHCPLPLMPDFTSPRRVSSHHSIFVSPWRSASSSSNSGSLANNNPTMQSKNFVPASPRQWLMMNNQGCWSSGPDSLSSVMTPMTKRLYSHGEDYGTSPITMVIIKITKE